jgi:hypothetical protein
VARLLNGGHECLPVRAWDVCEDPLTTPEWDASINRHLGQRNIDVVQAGTSPGGPVKLSVGQLFGQAHVYRVTAQQQGAVGGGYTVVLMG